MREAGAAFAIDERFGLGRMDPNSQDSFVCVPDQAQKSVASKHRLMVLSRKKESLF
jgi:hypothetical protein